VARLGGDEFVALLCELHAPADAEKVASKIIEEINQPIILATTKHRLGISLGIAVFPEDGGDEESLLRYADQAMYIAKKRGKNTHARLPQQRRRWLAGHISTALCHIRSPLRQSGATISSDVLSASQLPLKSAIRLNLKGNALARLETGNFALISGTVREERRQKVEEDLVVPGATQCVNATRGH